MVQLSDVLHLYLGCKIVDSIDDLLVCPSLDPDYLGYVLGSRRRDDFKPVLRPLPSLTMGEADVIAGLATAFGWRKSYKVESLDFADAAYIKVYYEISGSPHGIGDGEYMKQFVLSRDSIWGRDFAFRDRYEIVTNTYQIFQYLLKQGFDLFGLIESNQAIDATTLTPKEKENK